MGRAGNHRWHRTRVCHVLREIASSLEAPAPGAAGFCSCYSWAINPGGPWILFPCAEENESPLKSGNIPKSPTWVQASLSWEGSPQGDRCLGSQSSEHHSGEGWSEQSSVFNHLGHGEITWRRACASYNHLIKGRKKKKKKKKPGRLKPISVKMASSYLQGDRKMPVKSLKSHTLKLP